MTTVATTARALGPRPSTGKFTRKSGIIRKVRRIGIYAPEGMGKSSLAAAFPGVVFADLEHSTEDLNVERVEGINTWEDLRAWAQSVNAPEYTAIAIDSMTRAEDMCAEYVIRTKKGNDGTIATTSLEDYKYKAGTVFVCDEFRRFLGDLENAFNRGVNVIEIAHNRISRLKNPDGSDWSRQEPRLIHVEDAKGQTASNMNAWIGHLDELYFIDYDVQVDKGKARGSGTRTVYFYGTPTRVAKTRSLTSPPIEYQKGSARVWDLLLGNPDPEAPPL